MARPFHPRALLPAESRFHRLFEFGCGFFPLPGFLPGNDKRSRKLGVFRLKALDAVFLFGEAAREFLGAGSLLRHGYLPLPGFILGSGERSSKLGGILLKAVDDVFLFCHAARELLGADLVLRRGYFPLAGFILGSGERSSKLAVVRRKFQGAQDAGVNVVIV